MPGPFSGSQHISASRIPARAEAEHIGRFIQGQGLRGPNFAGFSAREYFRLAGVIEARALDGEPGRFIRISENNHD
jgi:hypothetical protein